MTTRATVAVLRTQPEKVLQGYQRLFELAGGPDALAPRRKNTSTRSGGPTLPGGSCSSDTSRKDTWQMANIIPRIEQGTGVR